jgi:hypothetical protein
VNNLPWKNISVGMKEKREITVNQSGQKQRFYRVRGTNEKSMNGRIGVRRGKWRRYSGQQKQCG